MIGPLPDCTALTSDDVHTFLIPADQVPPATLAHFETLLLPTEKERIAQLRIPHKRIESLVARASLRQILAHFLDTRPQLVVLRTSPTGKPFLENSPICFNLSHTTGMVLIAITLKHEIGVDIESATQNPAAPSFDFESLAQRFFTPAEHAALLAFPPAERLRAFYRCWTRKEALLKATGTGISGLKTFEVPPSPLRIPHHPLAAI